MDGSHLGIGTEAAQVVGGAAVATGGYGYFTKARGWKLIVGIVTSFGGGVMFFEAGSGVVSFFSDKPMPALSAGVAGTMTLGVIYALRKAAERLDLLEWFGRKPA